MEQEEKEPKLSTIRSMLLSALATWVSLGAAYKYTTSRIGHTAIVATSMALTWILDSEANKAIRTNTANKSPQPLQENEEIENDIISDFHTKRIKAEQTKEIDSPSLKL